MRLFRTCLLVLALAASPCAISAQTLPASAAPAAPPTAMPDMPDMPGMTHSAAATLPADPDIKVSLSTAIEDGKKQLIATVERNGKPVPNATVSFGVARMFGRLVLGSDVTLDDGTAAIPFPSDLPGDLKGNLELNAMVQGPLSAWGAASQTTLPGGTPKSPPVENFPRALWSPTAPLSLIAAVTLLVAGAWACYLFVIFQLIAIRRGAST